MGRARFVKGIAVTQKPAPHGLKGVEGRVVNLGYI
jgi:hypothetical protein